MGDNKLQDRRNSHQEEVNNGVETVDIITPLTPLPQSRRGRRQTLDVTDVVNAFGRGRVLSPKLGKRASELGHKWKTRRSSELSNSGQNWLFGSLPPGRKWYLPPDHPFLLAEIELKNGGNLGVVIYFE